MNPLGLDTNLLLLLGLVAHAIGDFLLQSHWMAARKADRGGWRLPRRRKRRPDPIPLAPDASPTDVLSTNVANLIASQPEPTASMPVFTVHRLRWWNRHPAAYVHAGIHGLLLAPIFGWPAAAIALTHLVIDTRTPVRWWGELLRQTPPTGDKYVSASIVCLKTDMPGAATVGRLRRDGLEDLKRDMRTSAAPVFDMGTLVRMMNDQAMHVVTLAAAAILIGGLP